MRFEGRVRKEPDGFWSIEVSMLGVFTQGETKDDAFAMVADAIEMVVNKPGFKVEVYPGRGQRFEVGADKEAALIAYYLRELRARNKVTLREASERLNSPSPNAYARYEQGKCVPTLTKLKELISAISPGADFLIVERAG